MLILAPVGCARVSEPADLVFLGGKIVTLDPNRPEATALAAVGDLFHESRVEVRELQELSLLCKCAAGEEYMHVGVEVGGVRAERLDREYEAPRDGAERARGFP